MFIARPSLSQISNQLKDSANAVKHHRLIMTVKDSPKFTIQFSGIYDYGVFELSGNNNGDLDPVELINGENYGVRHGVGANLTFKLPLHQKGNIRLNVSLGYNRFNSFFNKVLANVGEVQYASYNVFSFGAGVENNFTPAYKIKTYVSGGIIASVITGHYGLYNENHEFGTISIIPAFRLGVTLSSGFEYMLNNRLGLNFGLQFTHANLWLKSSKASDNPNEVYLNDKRVTPKLPYSGFKQFAWGSFFVGMNMYFGIIEKKYNYPKD